ncbi:putative Signal recognition particle [Taphrina deformans PYCC 5710]|uniref:Signal recognition particle subunit SRP68 n=1 Tax=Taphrina deformans (strain PYCC 5710 / ATCC 11124 / CBS 356.35 / IMI 108563 / JCM 9778 / NBRC 8474) TaxID=1097556 RepID=R4XC93_TAPDE|nr:putative Signal recognition particle [Taphrina deformans PYCC 5710]|eukprot:CCG83190.1 putative Signal recognition particle [Taphrina deformans PYCC 5710]
MSILSKIEYEREEFCRFDDYGRYAKHLSRKLHTLRKSTEKTHDILLYSAERVWANAMQNKSLNGKNQLTLNKLRKACKHAQDLVSSYVSGSPEERLQVSIYHDYLAASLSQERGAYDVAITHYSRALVALQNQSSSLMEPVETGLRFSIYQSGTEERSVNLQKFALAQLSSDDSHSVWRSLVETVNPQTLKDEKAEEMITSIQWAQRSAHLRNPELATSISTAVSARAALSAPTSPNDFDSILSAWSAASTTLTSLLDKEEDQNLSQDLELIKAWCSYHSSVDRIARDKALIPTVPSKEGILLCDSVNKTYTQVLALPGLDSAQEKEINTSRREIRGERCILLANTHGTSLEAIALLDRALVYYEPSSPRRPQVVALLNKANAQYTLSTNKHARFSAQKWFSGDVKRLGQVSPQDLLTKSVSMKPVVFDIAWNYIVAEQGNDKDGSVLQQSAQLLSKVGDAMDIDTAKDISQGLFAEADV